MIDSHELGLCIIEQILESHGHQIDEFEEYRDMHINPDNIEPLDGHPEWDK